MASINSLGVEMLALRGADSQYNHLSRFFATRAEAQTAIDEGEWVPTFHVHNACVTADEGLLVWDEINKVLVNADSATRSYVDTQISTLVSDAPAILSELNSISGQLADDAQYVSEINNKIDADIETERTRAAAAEADLATDIVELTTALNDVKDGFDFTGKVTAPVEGNSIPFYFADQTQFPDATEVHGSVAHSHEDGEMYYAHGGNWIKLLRVGSDISDVAGMDEYVSISMLKGLVSGYSTFDEFKAAVLAL